MEKQLTPQLRFPYLKDEWGKFEFSEIARRSKKSYNPNKDSENFPCIELESLSQETGQLIKTFDSINLKSNKTRFSKNEVLFGKLRPYLKKHLLTTFEGVCTSEIWVFQGKLVSNPFLYYLIQTNKFNFEANVSSGSKMPRTDWDYLSGIKFSIPKLSEEQQKIAAFLTDVDDKITKLTKKKTLLEQYKKGIMQKIFNQELRFKDENGNAFPEWEEKKLGDVFTFKQGFQFGVEAQSETYFKGSVEFIRIINVTSDKNDKRYVLDPGKEHHINKEDLFMVRYGDAGRVANGFTGIIANNMFRLLPHFEINKLFFFYSLGMLYKKIHSLSGSSTMPAISFSTINKLKIIVPSLTEQKKIANFLSDIDVKIEALNTKIENSKAFKKGLLQQMFV